MTKIQSRKEVSEIASRSGNFRNKKIFLKAVAEKEGRKPGRSRKERETPAGLV